MESIVIADMLWQWIFALILDKLQIYEISILSLINLWELEKH